MKSSLKVIQILDTTLFLRRLFWQAVVCVTITIIQVSVQMSLLQKGLQCSTCPKAPILVCFIIYMHHHWLNTGLAYFSEFVWLLYLDCRIQEQRGSVVFLPLSLVYRLGLGIKKLFKKDLLMTALWLLNFSFICIIMHSFLFLMLSVVISFFLSFFLNYTCPSIIYFLFFKKLILVLWLRSHVCIL